MRNLVKHVGRGVFEALSELGAARMHPPKDTREAVHRLAGAVTACARAHDIRVHLRGDVPRGAALVIANHVSYLDPIAVLPVCPAAPIAKGEVATWPLVGPIACGLGVVFVRRADPMARVRTLRRVHDLLADGVPVLNFAEGTTTAGETVGPMWRGTFGIAARLGVPVVPVTLRYRDPAMAWVGKAPFLPHYRRMASGAGVDVDLVFGAAMQARTGEAPEAMAARVRNTIGFQLERLHAGSRVRLSPARPDPVLPAARRVA